jgi:hypothetical protein
MMSANIATQNTENRYFNTRIKKGGGKFCKICKDFGRTLDEYTSHYVRESPNISSRVVCPTLNAVVCRYCNVSGHTVKHCPKIAAKNLIPTRTKESHIVSRNYCMPAATTTKNTSNVNKLHVSAFSVLGEDTSDEEEDDDEIVVTTPPPQPTPQSPPHNEHPRSYAGVLNNMPYIMPSQVDSLIPVKLNFYGDNVVTLDKITMRWADEEEDLDDCDILNMKNVTPPPFATNHPLTRFVSFVDSLAADYTGGFSKSIAITSDAFQQLSKNWETDFFNTDDGDKIVMDESQATNVRARSVIMTDRYILSK